MVKDTTLYDRLQVPTDADESQIKKSYFKLSKIWHPDKHQVQEPKEKEEASKKFQDIKEAYDILSDESKRGLYDQIGMDFLKQGHGQNQGTDPFSNGFPFGAGFPGMPFGAGFPGMPFGMNQGRQGERVEPIVVEITVTLEQVCKEESVSVTYPCLYSCLSCNGEGTMSGKPNPCNSCNGQGKKVQVVRMGNLIQQSVTDCPQCHGKGTVIDLSRACKECFGEGEHKKQKTRSIQLKAGLDNGHKMNLQGKGHYLKHGARSDLHVAVHVLPHPTFKRHENDLVTVIPLTIYQLLFGYTKYLTLLDGRTITLQYVGRTEPNSVRCISKEGLSHIQTGERGSLYVLFHLQLPELQVIPECRPLLESLDPTEVQREREVIASEYKLPVVHDPISIHSLYYQLLQQEQTSSRETQGEHPSQQRGQPQCVQQ